MEREVSSYLAKKMASEDMRLPASYTEMHCDEIEYISGEGNEVIGSYGSGDSGRTYADGINYLRGLESTHRTNSAGIGYSGILAGAVIGAFTLGLGLVVTFGYAALAAAESSAADSAGDAAWAIQAAQNAGKFAEVTKNTTGIYTSYSIYAFYGGMCC
ncbi:MAG: hypothetical protein LBJ20_07270 [Candidatus Methanoplasma sp.]|nr:hypothetical protein [Candidatus Methanoplasma sp.]